VTAPELPDQTGRTALVTGCTRGGLGYATSLELARNGAHVILAGRTEARLEEAEHAIRAELPQASLDRLVVDLADLGSVRRAAGEVDALDLLVNNAGVMAPPYSRTSDGFESQLGTNHLGPFLLTGLLLPHLVESGAGRIVTVSSLMHRNAGTAPLGDPLVPEDGYSRWQVYSQTKLANLLFTFEADRRLREAGLPVTALAAHPGFSGTHLVVNGQLGHASGLVASIMDAAVKVVSQSAADGALPTLMAATADLPGGSYCGPAGFQEWRGQPRLVDTTALARDEEAQRQLWELSEDAVGLRWP
jgi:NAD(P)-dependent dehydrogenase (short-subunit alcohol dehydrogenase family)